MNTAELRGQMVRQQVRTWDVSDTQVLDAMMALEREYFLPQQFAHLAYAETEIPIGNGQKTMTPLLEGRLLQALDLRKDDSVLEIGTGSGYLTACLASLSGEVTTIDIFPDFVDAASARLEGLGIVNVDAHCMDAFTALPEGRFDAVAVTGSVPRPDDRFLDVLRPGGRLFIVVGEPPVMNAQIVRRRDSGEWQATTLFETGLAPLLNVPVPSPFSF